MGGGWLITDGAEGSASTAYRLQYNNFQFPEYTTIKNKYQAIYGTDNSCIESYKCTMVVDTIIPKGYVSSSAALEETNDYDVDNLRHVLMTPNKILTYQKSGGGDLKIDSNNAPSVSTSTRKLHTRAIHGVQPQDIEFENLGDGQTTRVIWTLEFNVHINDFLNTDGPFNDNIIGIYHYAGFDITERQRLIQVERIKVVLKNRMVNINTGNNTISPDVNEFITNLLEFVYLGAPYRMNMADKSFSFELSPNRKELDVIIRTNQLDTDADVPNNVYKIDVKHRVSSSIEQGFALWDNEISGTIELFPGYHKSHAWFLFSVLFHQRYNRAIQSEVVKQGYTQITRVVYPRITFINIEDPLFGPAQLSFTVRYQANISSISNLQARTGLYELGDATQYANQYGWGFTERDGKKPVIKYRNSKYHVKDTLKVGVKYFPNNTNPDYFEMDEGLSANPVILPSLTEPPCPKQEDSWLDYQIRVKLISNRQLHTHQRYAAVTKANAVSYSDTSFDLRIDQQTDIATTNVQDIFHHVTGSSKQMFEVRGFAMRFGGPTNPPDIAQINNLTVELVSENIDDRIVSSSSCPLHLTKWVKMYRVTGTIQAGQNIAQGMDNAIAPERYQNG